MTAHTSDPVDFGVLRTTLAASLVFAALSGTGIGLVMSSPLLGAGVFSGLVSIILIVWTAMIAIVTASGARTIG